MIRNRNLPRHLVHDARLPCSCWGVACVSLRGWHVQFHGKIWRAYVLQRDMQRCFWCGSSVLRRADILLSDGKRPPRKDWGSRRDRATLDHLLALSHGGNNSPFNLVCCCSECNELRVNVDWRVFAQYLGRECYFRDAVAAMQHATYIFMVSGAVNVIMQHFALDLYRQAQHAVYGVPIDPHPGILPSFRYQDTGLWGVPVLPDDKPHAARCDFALPPRQG